MKKQLEEVNQKLDAQAKEIAELKSMVRQLLNPQIDGKLLKEIIAIPRANYPADVFLLPD